MKKVLKRLRRPDITFHANGKIEVMARLVKALGITPGTSIDIGYDGVEHYLYAIHHQGDARYEAGCWPSNGKGNNMRCSSVRLCRYVLGYHPGKTRVRLYAGRAEKRIDADGEYLAAPLIMRLAL